MINFVYQLIVPKIITPKLSQLNLKEDEVLVRPTYLAICHADQRYYRGLRNKKVLHDKLPMALIHEATGIVVKDGSGKLSVGQPVVMIPNIPATLNGEVKENYQIGAKFRSSGIDGFMQEYISIPRDRLVCCDGIEPMIAAITEFFSIGVHSVSRLKQKAVTPIRRVGVWGDGGLGYVVANVLKYTFPQVELVIVGQNQMKLNLFSFAKETYLDTELPADIRVDHAFECTGGQGCESAVNDIIAHIMPEGNIMLLGVSENRVPVFTRDVLEKGLTMVGSSRSGREDFELAVNMMKNKELSARLKMIISEVVEISSVEDINSAFDIDSNNMYKTVLKWNV